MREGQPRPPKPTENRDSLLNRMGRLAGKAALGISLAAGGYGVGHEVGQAEMVQPEKEHTEQEAKELAGKLKDMINLIDQHNGHHDIFYNVEDAKKERIKIKDFTVIFAQALGITPDFQVDPSVHPTWQESKKSDEIYELINQVLLRSGWNDKLSGANGAQMIETLRQQAQNLRGVESK